jgi:hypothetical protein
MIIDSGGFDEIRLPFSPPPVLIPGNKDASDGRVTLIEIVPFIPKPGVL